MSVPRSITGPSGVEVSALAFGSWNTWDRADFDTVLATLRLAVDSGVTTFDVGIYGGGETPNDTDTEMVFARAIAELGVPRDSIQLAVKGWLPDPRNAFVPSLESQLDTMLVRQHTDHAEVLVLGDLMQPRDDYGSLLDDVASVLLAGKARAWAVNNWAATEVAELIRQAEAAGVQAPDYAQLKYGLTRRSVPEGAPYGTLCARTGLRIQASDTFEGGLIFGGSGTGPSRIIGGDIGGTQERIRASVGRLREVAAQFGATPAQLAIAYPLTNPNVTNVLVGSRTPEQTRDNLGAFDLLARHSAAEIRAAADEFWFDRHAVSPHAGWGARPEDDPATYVVVQR